MGYGKVGFGKDEMRSYKLSHNGAVQCNPDGKQKTFKTNTRFFKSNKER